MTRGRRPLLGCGTFAAWRRGCRCDPCRKAKADHYRQHTFRRTEGSNRRIHLDEITELIQWGTSIEDIAKRLQVQPQSIYRLAYARGTAQERAVITRAMDGLRKHGNKPKREAA